MTDRTDIADIAAEMRVNAVTRIHNGGYPEISVNAANLVRLIDQLYAERQRADYGQKVIDQRNGECDRLIKELALKGKQLPYGYYGAETEVILKQQGHANITNEPGGNWQFPLFTGQQKPIMISEGFHPDGDTDCGRVVDLAEIIAAIESACCIYQIGDPTEKAGDS